MMQGAERRCGGPRGEIPRSLVDLAASNFCGKSIPALVCLSKMDSLVNGHLWWAQKSTPSSSMPQPSGEPKLQSSSAR